MTAQHLFHPSVRPRPHSSECEAAALLSTIATLDITDDEARHLLVADFERSARILCRTLDHLSKIQNHRRRLAVWEKTLALWAGVYEEAYALLQVRCRGAGDRGERRLWRELTRAGGATLRGVLDRIEGARREEEERLVVWMEDVLAESEELWKEREALRVELRELGAVNGKKRRR
ncbi:hypothetical protein EJ06DRAFT_559512 [Trichodelitschia bisporula]|uniref:Uncharacterized protein n=1 Tax=Trichodelitschia bisporula TaxID=703511 RepID=A0A6G1HLU1_9PEZI|nr:hypothetical protein EJ06DRAFT_559512 [Trichodelitschia bisporula]